MSNRLEIKPKAEAPRVIAIGGVDYPVSKPKLGQVAEMEEKLEAAKDDKKGVVRIMMGFVAQCGLPLEVVKELDGDELAEVIGFLTPSKKN
jgi:hypothetical protein